MSDFDVLLSGGQDAIEALIMSQRTLVSAISKSSTTFEEAVLAPSAVEIAPSVETVSQIAKIVSCSSIPGYWSVHLSYVSDAGEQAYRHIYVGANPRDGEYSLWESKKDFVEAKFEDYKGTVLVSCPESVSF